MMNQRQAVAAAVRSVVEVDPKIPVLDYITKDQLKLVHAKVADLFIRGEVDLKGNRTNAWIIKYVPSLVNNWLRKDLDLNGGKPYEAKNPGSRQGSGDETLKAMKMLLNITTNESDRKAIEEEIAKRQAAIKPAPKMPDFSKLPASLLERLGIEIVPASEASEDDEVLATTTAPESTERSIHPVVRKAE